MDNDNDKLDILKKKLYKEGADFEPRLKREEFLEQKKVRTFWDLEKKQSKQGRDFVIDEPLGWFERYKFLIGVCAAAVLFGILSFGAYYIYKNLGFNAGVISSKNIKFNLAGPAIIKTGQAGEWKLFIKNENEAGLELADLIIEYPEDSFSLNNEKLTRERKTVGGIAPGQEMSENIKFFSFGEDGQQKEIKVILEYRLEKSNAIFEKTEIYQIKLAGVSVGVSIDLPTETSPNKIFTMKVDYVSNSDVLMKDLFLKMEFPPAFQFAEASFLPVGGNGIWGIGDLLPNEKKTLEIKGSLVGQDLMEMGFTARVGFMDEINGIRTLGQSFGSVAVKQSFINVSFLFNGKDVDFIEPSSDRLNMTATWQNNTSVEVRNVNIKTVVKSDVVNFNSINVGNGFFRGYDNSLVWNPSGLSSLSLVPPAGGGKASFSFNLKENFPVNDPEDKNFTIELDGEVTGTAFNIDGQSVELRSNFSKTIKVGTRAKVASQIDYSSGELPARVGQETIYKVSLFLSSFYNDMENVVVKTSLPAYVRWNSGIVPESADIFYNQNSGEVVWRAGSLESGSGITKPSKEVSFLVSLVPSVTQANFSPVIIYDIFLEGRDAFTGTVVKERVFSRSLLEQVLP